MRLPVKSRRRCSRSRRSRIEPTTRKLDLKQTLPLLVRGSSAYGAERPPEAAVSPESNRLGQRARSSSTERARTATPSRSLRRIRADRSATSDGQWCASAAVELRPFGPGSRYSTCRRSSLALAHVRMVEVLAWIVRHSEPLHHRLRAQVADRGERHQLVERQHPECKRRGATGGFGGIAASPRRVSEAPTDLDRRREVRLEARPSQSGESEELARAPLLECPKPPTVSFESRLDPIDQLVALRSRERRREVLHHGRIGIERRERRSIARPQRRSHRRSVLSPATQCVPQANDC